MKYDIDKEWCMRMARLEGDAEIGAGMIPAADALIADMNGRAIDFIADSAGEYRRLDLHIDDEIVMANKHLLRYINLVKRDNVEYLADWATGHNLYLQMSIAIHAFPDRTGKSRSADVFSRRG